MHHQSKRIAQAVIFGCLLTLSSTASAQVTGFGGIAFGTSAEDASNDLRSRPGFEVAQGVTTRIRYRAEIAGIPWEVSLFFGEQGFERAYIADNWPRVHGRRGLDTPERECIRRFMSVATAIGDQYGQPVREPAGMTQFGVLSMGAMWTSDRGNAVAFGSFDPNGMTPICTSFELHFSREPVDRSNLDRYNRIASAVVRRPDRF
jgi:hypothetical protein